MRLRGNAAFIRTGAWGRPAQVSHVAGASVVLVHACLGAAFLSLLVIWSALGVHGHLYAAAPAAAGLIAWGAWAWRAHARRSRLDRAALDAGFPLERASSARVRIACRPHWGARLLERLDMVSGFEPEIARVPLAMGGSRADRKLAILGALAGLGAGLAFAPVVGTPFVSLYPWVLLCLVSVGTVALPEICSPTYVRIIPGRLDVLRFSLFRRRPVSLASFDLRQSRVLVDVRPAVVVIEAPGERRPARRVRSRKWPYAMIEEPGAPVGVVGFVLTPARRRLLETVCFAAVTDAPTPELPPDELLG